MPAGSSAVDGLEQAVTVADASGVEAAGDILVRQEWHLPQPVEAVWHAITHPGAWWGHPPEIVPGVGGRYVTFHGADGSYRVEDVTLQWEPPILWEHSFWRDVQPSSTVTWQLRAVASGTHLTLAHRVSVADTLAATQTVAQGDSVATVVHRDATGWRRILARLEDAMGQAGSGGGRADPV